MNEDKNTSLNKNITTIGQSMVKNLILQGSLALLTRKNGTPGLNHAKYHCSVDVDDVAARPPDLSQLCTSSHKKTPIYQSKGFNLECTRWHPSNKLLYNYTVSDSKRSYNMVSCKPT